MTKTTCDKCGKEIVVNPFMNASVANPRITIMKTCGLTWDKKSIDLCSDCQRAFLEWLDEALPQEQKIGHWIPSKDYECRPVWECSVCRAKWDNNPNFCPECGAKMIESEDKNEWSKTCRGSN